MTIHNPKLRLGALLLAVCGLTLLLKWSASPDPLPDGSPTCTLSVRCDEILSHMDWLDPDKVELVPADGILFHSDSAPFRAGETAYDLIQRELQQAGIHMDFSKTAGSGSVYCRAVGNLYELDCGSQSGWLFAVNGAYPGYGCDQYTLQPGDTVTLEYICEW